MDGTSKEHKELDMDDWEEQARHFLEDEKEFHLGFIQSEARNPLTMHLDEDFRESTPRGVTSLLACDLALLPHFRQALESFEFHALVAAIRRCRKVVFSGCGSSGRLSVLLESAWLEAHPGDHRVASIMTGGDFALVKSVENFEDYGAVGRQQAKDLDITKDDVLVGITATGETTSIVGSATYAAEQGAEVFMLTCTPPASYLRLERCRRLFESGHVTSICLPIGGMAITGSTRMQSSTIELAVAAVALELAWEGSRCDYVSAFEAMLDGLSSDASLKSLSRLIALENEAYRQGELLDYVARDLILDILSDTTERSPTFMIPAYKAMEDQEAPEPWAMLKDDCLPTPETWAQCLHREPLCIEWDDETYQNMGLGHLLEQGKPNISRQDLWAIKIGNEPLPGRRGAHQVRIDQREGRLWFNDLPVGQPVVSTPLRLFEHLRIKLAMNVISTGAMVKIGRVRSNYMIHLNISNKKLIDRACRIISELCHVSYERACRELFYTRAHVSGRESPVQATIARLEA